MRELTYSQLVEARACHEQLALFQERYGDQVSVTVEAAQEAAQLFEWDWAAENLLSAPAREAYRAVRDSALAAYKADTDSAWEAYRVARDSARDAYRAAEDSAYAAYTAAAAPALAAYRATQAEAFALAYISDAPIPTSETTAGSILASRPT